MAGPPISIAPNGYALRLAFIAVSYTRQRDGISVYLENLLLQLYKRALGALWPVEIDIFIGEDVADLLAGVLADGCRRGTATTAVTPRFVKLRRTGLAKFAELCVRLWRSPRYDLIVLPNPQPLIGIRGQSTLTVFHDFTYRVAPAQFTRRRLVYTDLLIRLRLWRDEHIGYVSDTTLAQLLKYYPGAGKRHLVYMPNGVPAKVAGQGWPSLEQLNRKFHASTIALLFVGRINRLKGVDRIHSICRALEREWRETGVRFVVHLVGKNTAESPRLLENMEWPHIAIRRHGYLPDEQLNTLYRDSAFCFFLSRNEGFGLPLIEAIRFGCIPVLSDIAIFREIMTDAYPVFADDGGAGDRGAARFILSALADRGYRDRLFKMMQSTLEQHREGYHRAADRVFELLTRASKNPERKGSATPIK